jgi:hypothetical protein
MGRSVVARRYRDIMCAVASDQGGAEQLSEARWLDGSHTCSPRPILFSFSLHGGRVRFLEKVSRTILLGDRSVGPMASAANWGARL